MWSHGDYFRPLGFSTFSSLGVSLCCKLFIKNHLALIQVSRDKRKYLVMNLSKDIISRIKNTNLKAIIHVKNRPFVVQENDLIYAPRDKSLAIGDVLEFNQVSEISSKDFVLQGNPRISLDFFKIKGVVIEHCKSPSLVKHVRGRKVQKKTITGNFLAYTCILVQEIKLF